MSGGYFNNQSGKTTADSTTAGFYLGVPATGGAQFHIGNSSKAMYWNGSSLTVTGDIIGTTNISSNAVTNPCGASVGADGAPAVAITNTSMSGVGTAETLIMTAPDITTTIGLVSLPLFLDVSFDILMLKAASQAITLTLRLKCLNVTTGINSVIKVYQLTTLATTGLTRYARADGVYIATPGTGNLRYTLTVQSSVNVNTLNEVEVSYATIAIIGMKR